MTHRADALTYQIIGAAMAAHAQLGPGFLESVYQAALGVEFRKRGIPHVPQACLTVYYDGKPLAASARADFLCYDQVIVELKANQAEGPRDAFQVLHYMKAAQKPVGLWLNFGGPRLQFRRFLDDAVHP